MLLRITKSTTPLSLIFLFILTFTISADEKGSPALIKADHIEYLESLDEVHAQGNVEISQEDKVLRADRVTYNRQTDLMTASGNVWIKESKGEIIFADSLEFTKKTSDGFIKEIKVIMTDNARLAARTGKKIGDSKRIFHQGVYSPCNICTETPKKACRDKTNPECSPLWQIKAEKVIQDLENQIVIYHHAQLQLFGVPVVYTPYFWHPDPSVKRKSGFLLPTYGKDSDLGNIFSTPFYYVINPNQDLIINPIFTSKRGPVIAAQYRHRFEDGDLTAGASYTKSSLKKPKGPVVKDLPTAKYPQKERWHFSTQGRFDLDEEHLLTFDVTRASDTTYLQRYPVLYNRTELQLFQKALTSTGSVEQFKEKSYASLRGYVFQTDAPKTTPIVFPLATYAYQTNPGTYNEIWNFDSSLMVIRRDEGKVEKNPKFYPEGSERLSVGTGWRLPYISSWGDVWTIRFNARADGYSIRKYNFSFKQNPRHFPESYVKGRFFPQAILDWRYPFINRFESWSWLVEPEAMVVSSCQGGNSHKIPNEDSLITLLDYSTVFIPNRFSGLDRVDAGHRVAYGLKNAFHFSEQRLISLFVGQSRRLDHRRILPRRNQPLYRTGEGHVASDYLTQIIIKPAHWFNLTNTSAYRWTDLRTRVSETSLNVGNTLLSGRIGHVFLSKDATMTGKKSSQIAWGIIANPTDVLTISFNEIRNLAKKKSPQEILLKVKQSSVLSRNLSITYHDECFKFITSIYRTSYRDRDLKPNSGIQVQLVFKNLGSFAFNPLSTFGGTLTERF